MVIRTPPQRPVILPVGLGNGKVVDAGDAPPHKSVLVELPVLVAIGAKPIAGVVVPLVGKAHGNPVVAAGPKLLDQTVIQLFVPLAGKEVHDGLSASEKLGTITPHTVRGVSERNPHGLARV